MTQQTWQHAYTRFPAVRRAMGRERVQLDDQQLEALLTERFGGAAAEDVENFMRDLQRFATRAAPVAQRVLVGAASGAATGAVGGLPGIIAGAAIGGTVGGLSGPQRQTPAPSRSAPRAASPSPAAVAPGQSVPTAAPPAARAAAATRQRMSAPRNSNAAAQLLMLLSRPETSQALLGLLMNRQRVPMGNQQVPAAAFANALAEIASLAAEQAAPLPPSRNAYYFHADGTPRCNLADDTARAQLLFSDLFGADICQCSARGTSV